MSDNKMPQRWDFAGDYDDYLVPLEEGDYVKVEDVNPLVDEINRLRARVEVLEGLAHQSLTVLQCSDDHSEHWCAHCDDNIGGSHIVALRAALKEAKP